MSLADPTQLFLCQLSPFYSVFIVVYFLQAAYQISLSMSTRVHIEFLGPCFFPLLLALATVGIPCVVSLVGMWLPVARSVDEGSVAASIFASSSSSLLAVRQEADGLVGRKGNADCCNKELPVTDADIDGSPAWLLQPLPGKHSMAPSSLTACEHPRGAGCRIFPQ